MRATFATTAVVLGLTFVGVLPAADDKTVKDDLALVQGHWERTGKDPEGKAYRVTKQIHGNKETITYMEEDGKVVGAHEVDFTLEESGSVRLFKYRNLTATAGPDKGKKTEGESSYIYKVDKDHFVEAVGLQVEDTRPPTVVIWNRAKK